MNKEEAVRAALGQVEAKIKATREDYGIDCGYDQGFIDGLNLVDSFIQNMDIDYKSSYEEDILDLINCLVLSDDNAEVKLQNALSEAFEEYLYNYDKSLVFDDAYLRYVVRDNTKTITLDLTKKEMDYIYDAINVAKEELLQQDNLDMETIESVIDKMYNAIKEV